jgi:polysaccharide pyruvyl transferase WcaK-like protein
MREAGYPVDPERLRRTPRTVYELMDIIDSGDVMVATRFHGTVLSLLAGKPTLGLCYYRKAADLLGEMGLRPFARLVEEFDVDEVLDRLEDLERDAGPIGATIQARGEEYRTALDEQYRAIFRPLVDRVPEPRRSRAIRRVRSGA